MQPPTLGRAGLSPSPYPLWTAISTTKSQTMPRVLATPVSRVLFTPLRSSNVPTAARPPAIAVAAGSFRHGNDHSYRKPACSYPCLIAMALASSSKESLQAGDIYKYIEQEFPYYQSLPKDNWKNSIRHSLSLGHYFRKVGSASGYQGRKGCFWEFVPEKKANIMSEVEMFMKPNGRSTKQDPASLANALANTSSVASKRVEQCKSAHNLPPCSPTLLNRQLQLPQNLPSAEPKAFVSKLPHASEPIMAKVSELPEANSATGLFYSNKQLLPAAMNVCLSGIGQDQDNIQPECDLTTTSVQNECNRVDANIFSSESEEVIILGGTTQSGRPVCQSTAAKQEDCISRKRPLSTRDTDVQPSNETKQMKLAEIGMESSLTLNVSHLDADHEDATKNASKRLKLAAGHFSGLECHDYTEDFNPITGFLQTDEKKAMDIYERSEEFRRLLAFQDELLKDPDCYLLSPQISSNTDVQANTDSVKDNEAEKTSNSQQEDTVLDVMPQATTGDDLDQELDSNTLSVDTAVSTDWVKELLVISDLQVQKPQQSRDADCWEYFFLLSGKPYPFAIHGNGVSTTLEQATDDKPAIRLSVKGYSLKPNATVIDVLVATVHQDADKTLSASVMPIQTNIFPGPNVTASIYTIPSEASDSCEFWLALKQHCDRCNCMPRMGQNQTQIGPWVLHPPAVSGEKWPEVTWNSQWGLKSFVN